MYSNSVKNKISDIIPHSVSVPVIYPYKEVLYSSEVNNCGLYLFIYKEVVVYIGRAASITLKRRLSEHVSYDNQFNTIVRKISKLEGYELSNINEIFNLITNEFYVAILPFNIHTYNTDGEYRFKKENRQEIFDYEKQLIEIFNPQLNKGTYSSTLQT